MHEPPIISVQSPPYSLLTQESTTLLRDVFYTHVWVGVWAPAPAHCLSVD